MNEQASQNVSVEQNGRVLTGGPGTSLEALEQAIERTAPEPATEAEPKATQATDEQPKATRGRERFSELTHQREEANKRALEANERAIALAERLERLEKRTAQAGETEPPRVIPTAPESAPSVAHTRPEPSEDEVGTKYAKYGDYVKDLMRWEAEQERAREREDRERTEFDQRVFKVRETAKERYPDFNEVLASGPGIEINIGNGRIDWLVSTPGGEHVLYNIAKDADLAHRMAAMSDYDFGMFVKGIMPSEQPTAPPQRASKAPAPYVPVNGGGRTTATTSADIANKGGSVEEYRAKRDAELGRKPRYR